MIRYQYCPICKGSAIAPAIQVKDFSVSGEFFPVYECRDCTARFTQDVPEENAIHPYYEFPDYISHTDTRKGLVNNLYHRVRKITLASKRRMVEKFSGKSSGALLDYGSGTGAFLHEMKSAGWNVSGLEPDPGARDKALQLYGITLSTPDQLHLIPDESVDVITLWHVLEHVHALHETMSHLKRVLKMGGIIFIAVPNYTSTDAQLYKSKWAAWDVPRHLYHFSPKAVKKLFDLHGIHFIQTIPMWFDSFYVSMLSEKYRTGKTGLFSAFVNGLKSNFKAMGEQERCSSLIYVGTRQ